MKLSTSQLKTNLSQFIGTTGYFYNPLYPSMKYTDGVKYLAENAGEQGAYWLLDIIGTEFFPKYKEEDFILFRLKVSGDHMLISVEDGNNNILETKDIVFTDFQEGEWSLYLEHGVLLLPSEH